MISPMIIFLCRQHRRLFFFVSKFHIYNGFLETIELDVYVRPGRTIKSYFLHQYFFIVNSYLFIKYYQHCAIHSIRNVLYYTLLQSLMHIIYYLWLISNFLCSSIRKLYGSENSCYKSLHYFSSYLGLSTPTAMRHFPHPTIGYIPFYCCML